MIRPRSPCRQPSVSTTMHSVIPPRRLPSMYSTRIGEASISSDTAQQQQPVSPSCSISKSVSFYLEANQEHKTKRLRKEQVCSLYYSRRDFRRFRRQTYETGKEIKVEGSCYEQVTTRVYEACCKANCDTSTVLTRGERLLLMMQCRDANVLGVETRAFDPINQKRKSVHRHLLDVVLALQEDEECDCELIRAHSERSSLPARLFARELALAVASGI
jgi:hypothetical protein